MHFASLHGVLDKSTAADIAAALVSSRLDYANSDFLRLAVEVLDTLAAHSKFSRKACITAAITILTLQQLHWLPVKWQIQFKLESHAYKVLLTGTPSHLSERLHPYVPSCTL